MSTVRSLMGLAILVGMLSGCAKGESDQAPRPDRAGAPLDPIKTAAHVAAVHAAAIAGDQDAVRAQMEVVNDDFRRSIKLADPSRAVDREGARQAARQIEGVRSVAWIDRENLFAIVDSNQARTYDTIDRICLALEPLGDTLGVVVNLQSGAASNGDELEILSRNCQLQPGDRALLSRNRNVDVIDPSVRAQHRANQVLSQQSEEDLARQKESMRALEANTPALYD